MHKRQYFTPELFKFLRQLKRNNHKLWFEENKDRYIEHVREPFLEFIFEFGPHLRKISPNYVADPRTTGGSMFRIYRDIRFAKDKTPYKTHAGAQFNHAMGKNVHAPGYYLHLEPGNVFACAGIWQPDSKTIGMIRHSIVDNPVTWKRSISGRTFKSMCSMVGDELSRPPRGFDPDHPLIEDLKRKDILALVSFTEKDACSPDFMAKFVRACTVTAPLIQFLTEAIGLEY